MRKNLVGMIYAYLVCFVSVCVLLGCIISGLYGIFKIMSPETTLSRRERDKILTVEKFKLSLEKSNKVSKSEKKIILSDEEIKVKYEEEKKAVLIAEKQEGIQSIIYMIISIIVCIPLYFIHIKFANKFGEKEVV
ncbi:MAG: hypothetical protein CVU80_00870 [Elusimicrobia bacterium HGW-Elusimicrobia-4]|nr:MAG: hypothetical protein CVU80_00870 [Elusimicrobia bacterium HGW-Elusimicrobia-4]